MTDTIDIVLPNDVMSGIDVFKSLNDGSMLDQITAGEMRNYTAFLRSLANAGLSVRVISDALTDGDVRTNNVLDAMSSRADNRLTRYAQLYVYYAVANAGAGTPVVGPKWLAALISKIASGWSDDVSITAHGVVPKYVFENWHIKVVDAITGLALERDRLDTLVAFAIAHSDELQSVNLYTAVDILSRDYDRAKLMELAAGVDLDESRLKWSWRFINSKVADMVTVEERSIGYLGHLKVELDLKVEKEMEKPDDFMTQIMGPFMWFLSGGGDDDVDRLDSVQVVEPFWVDVKNIVAGYTSISYALRELLNARTQASEIPDAGEGMAEYRFLRFSDNLQSIPLVSQLLLATANLIDNNGSPMPTDELANVSPLFDDVMRTVVKQFGNLRVSDEVAAAILRATTPGTELMLAIGEYDQNFHKYGALLTQLPESLARVKLAFTRTSQPRTRSMLGRMFREMMLIRLCAQVKFPADVWATRMGVQIWTPALDVFNRIKEGEDPGAVASSLSLFMTEASAPFRALSGVPVYLETDFVDDRRMKFAEDFDDE
jgi:hypothetical protein